MGPSTRNVRVGTLQPCDRLQDVFSGRDSGIESQLPIGGMSFGDGGEHHFTLAQRATVLGSLANPFLPGREAFEEHFFVPEASECIHA